LAALRSTNEIISSEIAWSVLVLRHHGIHDHAGDFAKRLHCLSASDSLSNAMRCGPFVTASKPSKAMRRRRSSIELALASISRPVMGGRDQSLFDRRGIVVASHRFLDRRRGWRFVRFADAALDIVVIGKGFQVPRDVG
jgi:hypothetical protein